MRSSTDCYQITLYQLSGKIDTVRNGYQSRVEGRRVGGTERNVGLRGGGGVESRRVVDGVGRQGSRREGVKESGHWPSTCAAAARRAVVHGGRLRRLGAHRRRRAGGVDVDRGRSSSSSTRCRTVDRRLYISTSNNKQLQHPYRAPDTLAPRHRTGSRLPPPSAFTARRPSTARPADARPTTSLASSTVKRPIWQRLTWQTKMTSDT